MGIKACIPGMKCFVCCSVLSAWGGIFLAVIGLLIKSGSPAIVVGNVPGDGVNMGKASTACFGAAAAYVGTFLLSAFGWWWKSRSTKRAARLAALGKSSSAVVDRIGVKSDGAIN